jgi:hypothetical protein
VHVLLLFALLYHCYNAIWCAFDLEAIQVYRSYLICAAFTSTVVSPSLTVHTRGATIVYLKTTAPLPTANKRAIIAMELASE